MDFKLQLRHTNIPDDCRIPAYEDLFNQVAAAYQALILNILSKNQTEDKIELVVGDKKYPIGLWSAEVCGSFLEFLTQTAERSVEEMEDLVKRSHRFDEDPPSV